MLRAALSFCHALEGWMPPLVELNTRSATLADTAAIAAIYNEGIVDGVATFETEPRSAEQIAAWFDGRHPILVAETAEVGPLTFAAAFPYSDRCCYAGIAEFSVYVARDDRGCEAGGVVLPLSLRRARRQAFTNWSAGCFPRTRRAAPF
jgi:phosphinothricin acetyltransferase